MQINYAESQIECRRVLLMHHFGETSFTAAQCKGTCDACVARGTAQVGGWVAQRLVQRVSLLGCATVQGLSAEVDLSKRGGDPL